MDSHGFETMFPRSLATPPTMCSQGNRKRSLKVKTNKANKQSERIVIRAMRDVAAKAGRVVYGLHYGLYVYPLYL